MSPLTILLGAVITQKEGKFMNNGEKILELLMQMQSDITELKTGQLLLRDNFVSLENNLVSKVTALFDCF